MEFQIFIQNLQHAPKSIDDLAQTIVDNVSHSFANRSSLFRFRREDSTQHQTALKDLQQKWQLLPKWLQLCSFNIPLISHIEGADEYRDYHDFLSNSQKTDPLISSSQGFAHKGSFALIRGKEDNAGELDVIEEEILHCVDSIFSRQCHEYLQNYDSSMAMTDSVSWEKALYQDLKSLATPINNKSQTPLYACYLRDHINKSNSVLSLLKKTNHWQQSPDEFWNNPDFADTKAEIKSELLPDFLNMQNYLKQHIDTFQKKFNLPKEMGVDEIIRNIFPNSYLMFTGTSEGHTLLQDKKGHTIIDKEDYTELSKLKVNHYNEVPSFKDLCRIYIGKQYGIDPMQVQLDLSANAQHSVSLGTQELIKSAMDHQAVSHSR